MIVIGNLVYNLEVTGDLLPVGVVINGIDGPYVNYFK